MDRICLVCQKPVPEMKGNYIAPLRSLACIGECADLVLAACKDYSCSRRGRYRTKAEWLKAIQEAKLKLESERPKPAETHIRWMLRRDMPEVLQISASLQESWPEDEFLRHLRARNCIGMVAEHGEKVVGFMIYELHKHSLGVLNFGVHPDCRYKGVGLKMVEKLKSKLSSHRRIKLAIQVHESNLDFLMFLKHVGFRALRMVRGADEITMEFAEFEEAPGANRIEAYIDGTETETGQH